MEKASGMTDAPGIGGDIGSVRGDWHGAVRSRRLLVDTIKALGQFADSVTVVGAHAVHIRVADLLGRVRLQATRDADIAIRPSSVAERPSIAALMERAGLGRAHPDRPGIYGFLEESDLLWSERTTVDLIVPEAYAGPGRRAARIPGQKNAATRAVGLELGLWDRDLKRISTLDEPDESVQVYVAGTAALLTAKAHKVHERLDQFETRPDRLRAKDSADVALLMIASDAAEVVRVMVERSVEHPEIGSVVSAAMQWIPMMYGHSGGVTRDHAVLGLGDFMTADEAADRIDLWLAAFAQAVAARADRV